MEDAMASAADGRIEIDALGERAPQAVLSFELAYPDFREGLNDPGTYATGVNFPASQS